MDDKNKKDGIGPNHVHDLNLLVHPNIQRIRFLPWGFSFIRVVLPDI
jgi:hypothetical protein